MLVKAKADVNAIDDDSVYPPLSMASMLDRVDNAEILLANGADLETWSNSSFGCRPLLQATSFNAVKIAALLLKHGPDVNCSNFLGHNALTSHLVFFDNPTIVQGLLDHGADIHQRIRCNSAVKPLIDEWAQAAAKGSTSHTHQIIGAAQGGTALHVAAYLGSGNSVKLLLEARADLSAKRDDGLTAAEVAQKHGHDEVAALILGKNVQSKVLASAEPAHVAQGA
eukprot:gnl/TRDRNA2_/TRDRNA2_176854_c13_seq3.p1 gnl/TRDRNA2_/TRDRNA2_176854_c13~~gnl/TRDRNA2_/TRDRNA2_176854_c13_seq3.p1  ORF type:complete len:225 (+),score=28.29 gnl/TRDRNA2_/TRDRNA2_176854_c13_seq3:2-676(+)